MNSFVASRAAAVFVLLSPVVFLVPIYAVRRYDALSVAAELLFYAAYVAVVACFVPLRPVVGTRVWRAWLGVCAGLAILGAALQLAAGAAQGPPAGMGDAVVNLGCAALCAAVALGLSAASRRFDHRAALELAFPLRGGLFEAIQAGSSRLLNHHVVSRAQRYGVDLVKVGAGPALSPALTAERLPTYALPVRSALAGTVLEAVDAYTDNPLGARDVRHPFGNHVVVRDAAGACVYFAHLKAGSVAVARGQHVEPGDLLGLVGNSGNSTEPHLHVHAERAGAGLPVTFGGRFLVRNSSIRAL